MFDQISRLFLKINERSPNSVEEITYRTSTSQDLGSPLGECNVISIRLHTICKYNEFVAQRSLVCVEGFGIE